MRNLARRMNVTTIDLADELCPQGPVARCNDDREADGLHIDPEDAPAVLEWLLERLPPEPWKSSPRFEIAPNPWLAGPLQRIDTTLDDLNVAPG